MTGGARQDDSRARRSQTSRLEGASRGDRELRERRLGPLLVHRARTIWSRPFIGPAIQRSSKDSRRRQSRLCHLRQNVDCVETSSSGAAHGNPTLDSHRRMDDRRTSSLIRKLPTLAVMLLMFCSIPPPSFAAELTATQTRPLRVATGTIAPFVLKRGDQWAGFSVDLWSEIARRMRADFVWAEAGLRDEQMETLRRGDADVVISAIVMTPKREQYVDFSLSYFASGLQIMVRAEEESPLLVTLMAIPWLGIGKLFAAAIVLMFLWANVLWFIERGRQLDRSKGYVPGIGEEMWNTTLIIATGEHGERSEPGRLRRFVIAGVWLMGIVLIAQLTATVTSSQTVHRLRSSIGGPGDLPGKTIATAPGTIAAAYLTQRRIPFVAVSTAADAIDLLTQGRVQALVFDAPTLHYWLATSRQSTLQIVGPVFMPEMYGIAVALGSPLRKRINEALLEVYQDGTYERIYGDWFARR